MEDQQHRLTVSGFDVASGMKNPTSGDFSVMLNSVYAAQHPHHFVHRGWEVDTTGNPLAHVILRGAVNKTWRRIPNYHYEDLIRLNEMYEKMDLVNPACIVDANHSNSNKKYEEQVRIVKEVMHNRKESGIINKLVKGVMIESYICRATRRLVSIFTESLLQTRVLDGKNPNSFCMRLLTLSVSRQHLYRIGFSFQIGTDIFLHLFIIETTKRYSVFSEYLLFF